MGVSILLVVPLTFLLAALAPLFHRLLGRHGGKLIALGPAVIFVWLLTAGQSAPGHETLFVYDWVPRLGVTLALRLDGLALLFALVITGIGAAILLYSGYYMEGDPRLSRFQTYLFLFMGAMLGIVLADDLITLYCFWEMTSIVSFLLIGFNNESERARAGALKALLITSGGGLALLLGFVLLGQVSDTYRISELISEGGLIRADTLYLPVLLLISLGAFTKSAQFPFHFWLPDAMQAPTSASAYLHSATMVKAGVYLLARLLPVLGGTLSWQYLLGLTGLLTFVMGAYLAFKQTDLKAMLAYTTISALGQMVALIGIGTPLPVQAAMIAILAHALYKSVLFLVVGIVESETGTRNLNALGGLARGMPITATIAGIAALSMAGIPPLFGFLAKEMLLEAGFGSLLGALPPWFVPAVVIGGSLIGVAYSLVFYRGVFLGPSREQQQRTHDAPWGLLAAPLVLALFSVILTFPPAISVGSNLIGWAAGSTLQSPAEVNLRLWHGINLPLLASIGAVIGGVLLYSFRERIWALQHRWPTRWAMDTVYDTAIVTLNQVALRVTRVFQSGALRHYLINILVTMLVLVVYALIASGARPTIAMGMPDIPAYQWVVAGLMIVAAIAVTSLRTRLSAVVALAAIGFLMALIFVIFSAPDLALTQMLVETLTVILLLLVLYFLPQFYEIRAGRLARFRDVCLATGVGGLVTILVWMSTSQTVAPPISDYYIENSLPAGYGANVVNVILVDFRALDTLGEMTVLIVAVLSIYGLIKLRPAGVAPQKNQEAEDEKVQP